MIVESGCQEQSLIADKTERRVEWEFLLAAIDEFFQNQGTTYKVDRTRFPDFLHRQSIVLAVGCPKYEVRRLKYEG